MAVAVGLVTGGFVGCFSGDGLLGQPCHADADCNVVAAVSSRRVVCQDGVCGAICGDGVVTAAAEECDDGNDVDTDGCVACKLAVCGDDVTRAGVEACDDGNDDDTDACVGCQLAVCGDGLVWAGKEECDDAVDAACTDCVRVACGDGRVDADTELCDDGNLGADDGCNAQCVFGAVAIAGGGGSHTCAIGPDGALERRTLRCWGANSAGQLGHGSVASIGDEASDLPPTDVPLPAVDVLAVAVGRYHTCALLDGDDNVRCWGSNDFGQLGLPGLGPLGDEKGEPLAPAVAIGGLALEIAAGRTHTCARLAGGAVRCWGSNEFGQLGYPGISAVGIEDDPAAHPTLALAPVRQLSAGGDHTCAVLMADRSVRCWGRNWSYQLGVETPGTLVSDPAKSQPVALGQPAELVSAGEFHTCALLAADRSVRCWGGNDAGQTGHHAELMDVSGDNPSAVVGAVDLGGRRVEQVRAGARHTCVVVEGGEVWCWGVPMTLTSEQQGEPTILPPGRVALTGSARGLALGERHTCVLFGGGGVACWGNNWSGELGLGHTRDIGDDPGELPPPPVVLYPTLAPGVGP